LLFVVLAIAALAVPASAAGVDPARLVLQRSDVPAGFRLDRDKSGPRTNAAAAQSNPALRSLFARAERTGGYVAEYQRGDLNITSRADLFRRREGAGMLFTYFDRVMRNQGVIRNKVEVGTEARIYSAPALELALIAWRRGRVFASLATTGLPRAKALALAHTQDRRIAKALR
jgi:hypothetical protein